MLVSRRGQRLKAFTRFWLTKAKLTVNDATDPCFHVTLGLLNIWRENFQKFQLISLSLFW